MEMTIGRKRENVCQIDLKFAVRAKSRNSDNIGACLRLLSQVVHQGDEHNRETSRSIH